MSARLFELARYLKRSKGLTPVNLPYTLIDLEKKSVNGDSLFIII